MRRRALFGFSFFVFCFLGENFFSIDREIESVIERVRSQKRWKRVPKNGDYYFICWFLQVGLMELLYSITLTLAPAILWSTLSLFFEKEYGGKYYFFFVNTFRVGQQVNGILVIKCNSLVGELCVWCILDQIGLEN